MKLFGSTKKLIDKTKNSEIVLSLKVFGGVLVQCNVVDNQYQQKFEVLNTYTPNKFESSNLAILKTCNIEFDEIIRTFTDQNGRSVEIEDKFNLTMLIDT